MAYLDVKNISTYYGDLRALEDVNFSIGEGEFWGIIGPNGAGKSTLLRNISRVLEPSKGQINLNGKNLYRISPREVAREIAFVPEETLITFAFSCLEIVLMGRAPYMRRFALEGRCELLKAKRALKIARAEDLAERPINELSSGERQRVILARALCQEPRIMILDEPTSHLDMSYEVEIFEILKSLQRKSKITVITVLHDLNLALRYCDHFLLLNNGRVVIQGNASQVMKEDVISAVYGIGMKAINDKETDVTLIYANPKNLKSS